MARAARIRVRTAARTIAFTGALALAGAAAACGPRQAEVRTAPAPGATATLQVNNNLAQAVNVYARIDSTDTFLRQVAANSSVMVPVLGFAAGATVTLKAVTVDGTRTFTRANVTLTGTYVFPLP
jgi:hypothetical protein